MHFIVVGPKKIKNSISNGVDKIHERFYRYVIN